jgi:putative ABC transport system ATP-binding protein
MEILKVVNLSKAYGTGNTLVKALDNVSFSIEEGEFVAIIGPSGTGKSTLMHIIGGVDQPTNGQVLINGIDIYNMSDDQLSIFRRKKIGLIYQFYNLIPVLNIEENITLPLLLDNQKVDKEYLKDIIDILKLKDRIKHLPNELSGGEQQRVAIGRALITKPALILADEPTGNLDSKRSKEIMELLKESNKKYKQTIILVTHNNDLASQVDRIITIDDGKMVSDVIKS